MKSRLICLDLDGTLLNDDKIIPKKTLDYLNFLVKNDSFIAIATGRHLDYAEYLTRKITRNKFIVSTNGAITFYKPIGIINKVYLDSNLVIKIIECAKDNNLYPNLYYNPYEFGYDMLVTNKKSINFLAQNIVRDLSRIANLDKFTAENVLSITINSNTEQIELFLKNIESQLKNSSTYHIMNSSYTDESLLEIMGLNVTKWSGIKNIIRKLNFDKLEIISFGDDINDYTMLKNSDISFVMKNSNNDFLLDRFNKTLYTNNENGVFYELKRIYDGESIS
ncbi:HAD family hydrolase [Citroniella saccharovorans]|uniref:HAD family hydrolase n=1 Tax=Citroniella saccharovorans TaxID=2053367 RepID=UPI002D79667E|nr:HAD family hydrolase [Citroniella saccharovorans]